MGLKGVVVAGSGDEKTKAFESQPRGGLGSFAKLTTESKWLRERNPLLSSVGSDGKTRVLICEGGVCKEEGLVEDLAIENLDIEKQEELKLE